MLQAALQTGEPVSLMMIDIDYFKSINDRHGHVEGDRVIRDVAAVIAAAKREEDQLFRYGGEEFALLCPGAPSGTIVLAERIRRAMSGIDHLALEQPVTVSVGVATFPAHSDNFSALILRADAALYEAKALGRNRVISASEGDAVT